MYRARNSRILVDCKSLLEEIENGYSVEASLSSGRKLISGIVVRVDPKLTDIHVGDVVVFPRYAANELSVDGKMFFSIHSDDTEYVKE